jgi:hypothetical protein
MLGGVANPFNFKKRGWMTVRLHRFGTLQWALVEAPERLAQLTASLTL